jgi:putative transposase
MTEDNHCYENALAERVNGIQKDEFHIDQTFACVEEVKKATKLYNFKRLHLSLEYKRLNHMHQNAV